MKKSYYILFLFFVLIAAGIFLLKPKNKNITREIENKVPVAQNKIIKNDSLGGMIIYEITGIKALTSENYYAAPVWSPDGKKIAMTSLNFKGIYVDNLIDGTHIKITDDEGSGFRFSWSPDSKEIVYLSRMMKDGEPDNSIKIADIATGEITDLTIGKKGVSMPCFSAKKGIIYSIKGKLIFRTATLDKNTMKKSYTTEEIIAEDVPANIIVPSPSDDILIIEDDTGIKIMDCKGQNRKTIIKNGEYDFACNSQVSPDGSKVLFFNNVGTLGHLFVYEIENEKITDLGAGSSGQWLPNGKVLFSITANDGYVITGSEIYIINADGTGKLKITDTENQIELQPAVSPDGRSISYRDEKSGKILMGNLEQKSGQS